MTVGIIIFTVVQDFKNLEFKILKCMIFKNSGQQI